MLPSCSLDRTVRWVYRTTTYRYSMKLIATLLSTIALSASLATLPGCGGGNEGAETAAVPVSVPAPVPVPVLKSKIFAIGASFSSDGPEDPRDASYESGYRSGDSRYVNGAMGQALWLEVLANKWGALSPVSNSRAPSTAQSATNFARGDAQALETRSATKQTLATVTAIDYKGSPSAELCISGICNNSRFPKSAYDQWLTLAATSPVIGSSDALTIDIGGIDLLSQHLETHPGVNVTTIDPNFISDRVLVIESIVNKAIAMGFKNVVVANVPALQLLPGIANSGVTGMDVAKLAQDVTAMNASLAASLAKVKAANPSVHLYSADWNAAITRAVTSTNGWTTLVTSTAGDDFAFAISETADVMWWDRERIHPSGKLHKYLADNLISEIH